MKVRKLNECATAIFLRKPVVALLTDYRWCKICPEYCCVWLEFTPAYDDVVTGGHISSFFTDLQDDIAFGEVGHGGDCS